MRLSEHPLGIEWLRQFDRIDVHAARFALDSLKLVSFTEFETAIISTVKKILGSIDGRIAIRTLDKKIIDPSSRPGSEDRLGHILTGLSRAIPERLLINPSFDCMVKEKIKDVVLIDDFVASGTRLVDFLDAWESKRLKSWISFGYCKLWLTGYAIHRKGLVTCSEQYGLAPDRIIFDVTLELERDYWPPTLSSFFERNAGRTHSPPFSANFGGIQSPLVFQHGCPDNAPAVFCRSGPAFAALFPNRSIPPALYPCFDGYSDSYRTPELLWRSGQPTLALRSLEDIASNDGSFVSETITLLGLLAKGLSAQKLPSILTTSTQAISTRIETCINLGLLDSDSTLTPFAHDLLTRSKRRFLSDRRVPVEPDPEAIYYIPEQFSGKSCGVQ